jgi:hypothetical protein
LLVCSAEKDICVTTTGGCSEKETRRLARIITETIIAEASSHHLPADDEAQEKLVDRLASLRLPPAAGSADAGNSRIAFGKTFHFAGTPGGMEKLRLDPDGAGRLKIRFGFRGEDLDFVAGHGKWMTADLPLDAPLHRQHSFTYGWLADGSLEIKQCLCNTPYHKLYRLFFGDDSVNLSMERNILHRDDKPDKTLATGYAERARTGTLTGSP